MKKLITVLAVCAVCLSASAQTAKVIALSPEDAAKAKALYQQKAELERQIDELTRRITILYLAQTDHDNRCDGTVIAQLGESRHSVCVGAEWVNGFELSDDYRFIVPKTPATYPGPIARLPYERLPPSLGGKVTNNASWHSAGGW